MIEMDGERRWRFDRDLWLSELEKMLAYFETEYGAGLRNPESTPEDIGHYQCQLHRVSVVRSAIQVKGAELAAAGMLQIEMANRNVAVYPFYDRGRNHVASRNAATFQNQVNAAVRRAEWTTVLRDLERGLRREPTWKETVVEIQKHEQSKGRSVSEGPIKRFLKKKH